MQVKICGMCSVADAVYAARCGAEYVGVILARSARGAPLTTAAEIVAAVPASTAPVLVFRDESLRAIRDALAATGAGWVQLHGREDADFVAALASGNPPTDVSSGPARAARTSGRLRIVKAWELGSPDAELALHEFVRATTARRVRLDAVLLDLPKATPPEPGACPAAPPEVVVDFAALSRRWPAEFPPLWCSGGLTAETLAATIASGRFQVVDVARGVESAPGRKDAGKVRRFIAAARLL
ncbi:MAG: hypothetical protein AB7Q17_03045 [Phycisphaerae bacterium]